MITARSAPEDNAAEAAANDMQDSGEAPDPKKGSANQRAIEYFLRMEVQRDIWFDEGAIFYMMRGLAEGTESERSSTPLRMVLYRPRSSIFQKVFLTGAAV